MAQKIKIVKASVGIHKSFKLVVIGFQDEPIYFGNMLTMRKEARSYMRAGRAVKLYTWGKLTPQDKPDWIETSAPTKRNLFKTKEEAVVEGLQEELKG